MYKNSPFTLSMSKKIATLLLALMFLLSCSSSPSTSEASISKAHIWLDRLDIDFPKLVKEGYPDKKHLSEILGAYWKIYRYSDEGRQKEIR